MSSSITLGVILSFYLLPIYIWRPPGYGGLVVNHHYYHSQGLCGFDHKYPLISHSIVSGVDWGAPWVRNPINPKVRLGASWRTGLRTRCGVRPRFADSIGQVRAPGNTARSGTMLKERTSCPESTRRREPSLNESTEDVGNIFVEEHGLKHREHNIECAWRIESRTYIGVKRNV
eukprot:Gb_14332 [translate_table: standard]